jgi:hypothetical protein
MREGFARVCTQGPHIFQRPSQAGASQGQQAASSIMTSQKFYFCSILQWLRGIAGTFTAHNTENDVAFAVKKRIFSAWSAENGHLHP